MVTIKRQTVRTLSACLLSLLLLWTSAEAEFLSNFEGFSVFGTPNQCQFCDSTISFAVWQNTDGDWRDDLPVATAIGAASDGTEQYVYLYQVVNTDPLGMSTGDLENFNITYGEQGGSLTPNPFLAGGFFGDITFDNVSSAVTPLDIINDGSPSSVSNVTPFQTDTELYNPYSQTTGLVTANAITGSYPAIQFQWSAGNKIPECSATQMNCASSVLFLTSNHAPTYRWAKTASTSLIGSGGDVPSVVFSDADGDLAPYGAPDGVVNAADVLIAYRIIFGHITPASLELAHGDMNGDGIINLPDLLQIQQIVLP